MPMLDVLGCGHEAGNGICAFGEQQQRKKYSSAHPPPLGPGSGARCGQRAKEKALHRRAWLTTESTSAFLERAIAWQLKLRRTGLEIRCYF